jgi:hypothetical protein
MTTATVWTGTRAATSINPKPKTKKKEQTKKKNLFLEAKIERQSSSPLISFFSIPRCPRYIFTRSVRVVGWRLTLPPTQRNPLSVFPVKKRDKRQ